MRTNASISETVGKVANPTRLAYTVKETAEILGISPTSVYRLIQRGKLRCLSALRHRIIPAAEIQKFVSTDLT